MSITSDDAYEQDDITKVLEMASEPSYLSEIARKLEIHDPDWGLTGTASVEKVSIVASMMDNRNDVDFYTVDFGNINEAQYEASPISSLTGQEDGSGYKWNDYTIMHYSTKVDVRDEFEAVVDQSIVPREKIDIIDTLSGDGNVVSKQAEKILQDCLKRQFRHYDMVVTPDYNDPGVDFYVEDEGRREWGLAVEISVRWVNPIGKKYIEAKKEKAFEQDADLLILAPKFTQKALREYEDTSDPKWNSDPLSQMVHLHTVPTMDPSVYYPFAKDPDKINERDTGGNPVIVPDGEQAQERLSSRGHVGDAYPVVDDSHGQFIEALNRVNREHTVISESEYRNEIRESIEPLLWEFLKPYKIEQFLQQMYWGEELTQGEIGELVGRGGGTIGTWMRRWGVMRRGGGAPEVSEETLEIWKRMYEGRQPFPGEFSGYRILAEYNRHPLWGLDDWIEWYKDVDDEGRKEASAIQDSHRDGIGYTLLFNPSDRLQPSYTFIMDTLRDEGVEIRDPDAAPRVPYNAYPSKGTLEYMLNKDQNTIVDVGDGEDE